MTDRRFNIIPHTGDLLTWAAYVMGFYPLAIWNDIWTVWQRRESIMESGLEIDRRPLDRLLQLRLAVKSLAEGEQVVVAHAVILASEIERLIAGHQHLLDHLEGKVDDAISRGWEDHEPLETVASVELLKFAGSVIPNDSALRWWFNFGETIGALIANSLTGLSASQYGELKDALSGTAVQALPFLGKLRGVTDPNISVENAGDELRLLFHPVVGRLCAVRVDQWIQLQLRGDQRVEPWFLLSANTLDFFGSRLDISDWPRRERAVLWSLAESPETPVERRTIMKELGVKFHASQMNPLVTRLRNKLRQATEKHPMFTGETIDEAKSCFILGDRRKGKYGPLRLAIPAIRVQIIGRRPDDLKPEFPS